MTTRHTPGPWEVWTDKATDGTPYIRVYQRTPDGEHITICTMGISDGEAWGGYVGEEEDARLIAASLDLLTACELFIAAESMAETSGSVAFRMYAEAIDAAKAAVAKARGEP